MSIKTLNPYLNFDGNAAKAIQHYERTLGAQIEVLQRFGEVPSMPVPPEHRDRIMHAQLRLGGGTVMLSDTQPGTPFTTGGNVQVVLHFDDLSDARTKFDALAEGGKITMPLQDTFWGATFGMLTDGYGVDWMFNCQKKA